MTIEKKVVTPTDLGSGHAIDLLTNKAIVPSADVWRKQSDNTQAGADSDAIQHTGNVALKQNLALRVKSLATAAQINSTDASNIRLTSGGIVQGIMGGEDGKQLTLTNVSAANITLTHNSATAPAGTKLRIAGGLNFILAPDDSIVLYYDPVSLLWRVSQSVMGAIVNNPQLVCALSALLTPVPLLDAFGKMIGRIAEPTEHTFKFTATTAANLALVLSNGGTYTVDWGDGSPVDTVASSAAVYATHTYASAYTGNVVVKFSCGRITELRSTAGNMSGSVADLPAGLTVLYVTGNSTLSGSVADLPAGLTHLILEGNSTLSGSVADLPAGLTYLSVAGNNTLSGSVADLPTGLTVLYVAGYSTLSGSAADLPTGLTVLYVAGNSTLSGSVADLPTGLTYVYVAGNSTLSGSVADLPAGLTHLSVAGYNTLSGSVADLPAGLTYLNMIGNNTLSAPTVPTFAASMRLIQIHGAAKSAAFVDNILAGAANVATWTTEKLVNLRGTNAAPTAAGLASKAVIESKGAVVQVN